MFARDLMKEDCDFCTLEDDFPEIYGLKLDGNDCEVCNIEKDTSFTSAM